MSFVVVIVVLTRQFLSSYPIQDILIRVDGNIIFILKAVLKAIILISPQRLLGSMLVPNKTKMM